MSKDEFDWRTSEEIVFRTAQGIAVYRNPDGDIVIRQQAGALEDEDTFIVVPYGRLELFILSLQNELE